MPEPNEEQRRAFEEKIKNMSPEELKEFQKQQCIFCQIIAGKIPSKKVYEDDKCIAVMDINPAAIGHVLLLSKEHYAIMPQVPDEEIGHMFMVAKHLSQAMLRKLKVEGTNIFVANGPVAGQNAQHFMIHVIPRKDGDGILELPKRLVDEPLREQLREVIGKKADALFGVEKKEESEEEKEEKEEEKEEPTKKPSPDHPPQKEDEEKEEESEEEKGEEKEKEDEGEEEDNEKEEKEDEEKEDEGEDKTDLDDIAEMFK